MNQVKTIEEAIEQIEKQDTLYCPCCNTVQEIDRDNADELVSFYGSDEAIQCTCQNPECGKIFYAHEVVTRYYHTVTTEEHETGLDNILESTNGNS